MNPQFASSATSEREGGYNAANYETLLDARIDFLRAKMEALHCERLELEKLQLLQPRAEPFQQTVSSQIVISGTIGDLRKPGETFKVKTVELGTLRLPEAGDFQVPCHYLVKNEELRQQATANNSVEASYETVSRTLDGTSMPLQECWQQLLPGGEALLASQEGSEQDLTKYLGVVEGFQRSHCDGEQSTADMID